GLLGATCPRLVPASRGISIGSPVTVPRRALLARVSLDRHQGFSFENRPVTTHGYGSTKSAFRFIQSRARVVPRRNRCGADRKRQTTETSTIRGAHNLRS